MDEQAIHYQRGDLCCPFCNERNWLYYEWADDAVLTYGDTTVHLGDTRLFSCENCGDTFFI